jgi:hypothetical protein
MTGFSWGARATRRGYYWTVSFGFNCLYSSKNELYRSASTEQLIRANIIQPTTLLG